MIGVWCCISADHPSLPDHFPGNPVVPAVVTLDEVITVAEEAGFSISGMPAARLLNPLAPGVPFLVRLTPKPDGSVMFEVERDDRAWLARGRLATT